MLNYKHSFGPELRFKVIPRTLNTAYNPMAVPTFCPQV